MFKYIVLVMLCGCSASVDASHRGALCDIGTEVVAGCDGVVHTSTIVRWTQPDGNVVTCWEGQAVVEPFGCETGTECVVFTSDGSRHAGVCR